MRERVSHNRRLVDHPAPTPQATPCRIWQGATLGKGYGSIPLGAAGAQMGVHRWVVQQAGEDQFGTEWNPALRVMHLCDNTLCFRYHHLRLGTPADNSADMVNKGRNTNGKRKLTEYAVRWIRSHHATGHYTLQELAEMFDMSLSGLHSVVVGRSWNAIHSNRQKIGES